MGLKLKFLLAFLTCTLITLAVIVFSLVSFRQMGGRTDTMVQRDIRINQYANVLARELARSRRAEKEFFIFPRNEKKQLRAMVEWRKSYTTIRDRIVPMLESLYREAGDTAALAKLAKARELIRDNMAAFDAYTAKFRKTRSYDRADQAGYGEFKDRTHTVEDIADDMVNASMARVRGEWRELASQRQRTGMILQLSFVAALLWGLLLPVVFAGRLSRALAYLTKIAVDISQGRLGEEIRLRRRDEIGRLAKAIGQLQKSMRIVMDRCGGRDNQKK
jgi:methyl-accepting chemotaxis protein